MRVKYSALAAVAAYALVSPATAQAQQTPADAATTPQAAPRAVTSTLPPATPTTQDAAVAAPAVQADATADPAAGGDIIVTAQRRSESVQRVPISITALPAEALAKTNITSVADLGRVVPSFNAFRSGQAANTRLSIRGIGSPGNSAIEPSVGAFVDGIYIARPGPLLAGLNDVSGVEVLRGPQGTLFGRNASVGAVSIHTAEPTHDASGSAFFEGGNYGRARIIGVVNAPVSDTIALRFSALADRFDGYGYNTLTNARFGRNNTLSLRGAAKIDLTPTLTWLLRGDYQRQLGDGAAVATVDAATVTSTFANNFNTRLSGLVPILNDTYTHDVRQNTTGSLRDRQGGGSSTLSLDLGEYQVKLLSGLREWRSNQSELDITGTPAVLYGRDASYLSKSHSEEFQIVSPADRALSGVAGLYYFRERYDIQTIYNLGSDFCDVFIRNTAPTRLAACRAGPQQRAGQFNFHQITESYAAFGQATYKVLPTVDLVAGIRYSNDKKTGTLLAVNYNSTLPGNVPDTAPELSFDGGKVTYRLNANYRPTSDLLFFITYATGYKSGGFDTGTGTAVGNNRVFNPETVSDWEIGAKMQFLDRRITLNATAFRMDVDDFQLRSFTGTFYAVRNAGSIRQKGVEFDIAIRPARDLTLSVSGTRLDSEYTDFRNAPALPGLTGTQDLTGQRVPYSPKWQGVAAVDYTREVGGGYRVGFNTHLGFTSDIDVGIGGDGNPQGIQNGYALLGTRLALTAPQDRWEVALSGENLTDKRYCTNKYGQVFATQLGLSASGRSVLRCNVGDPATVRASFRVAF